MTLRTILSAAPPRRARNAFVVGLIHLTLMLGGCRQEDIVCAGVALPGIDLTVQDATTKQDLEGTAQVLLRLLDPPFDSLVGSPQYASGLAADRPGAYHIRVAASGYQTQQRTFTVPRRPGSCSGVVTQRIVVELPRALLE